MEISKRRDLYFSLILLSALSSRQACPHHPLLSQHVQKYLPDPSLLPFSLVNMLSVPCRPWGRRHWAVLPRWRWGRTWSTQGAGSCSHLPSRSPSAPEHSPQLFNLLLLWNHVHASPADLLQRLNTVHGSLIYSCCGTMFASPQQISFSAWTQSMVL